MADRRDTIWVDTLFNDVLGAGTQQVHSLMGGIDPLTRGGTLTRTLVCLYAVPSPIGGAAGMQMVNIGVGVASQEAFTAGIVADPQEENDFPQGGWVYRCRHAVIDDPTPGYPTPLIKEDLRAMRKINRGELYLTFVSEAGQGVAFAVRLVGIVRCLVKLP